MTFCFGGIASEGAADDVLDDVVAVVDGVVMVVDGSDADDTDAGTLASKFDDNPDEAVTNTSLLGGW